MKKRLKYEKCVCFNKLNFKKINDFQIHKKPNLQTKLQERLNKTENVKLENFKFSVQKLRLKITKSKVRKS